jgi:structural maintenance of chromosomes protein 5
LTKGQLVLDYANSVEALRSLHIQLMEAQILEIEAKSDHDQLRQQHAEEERLLQETRSNVEQLARVQQELLAKAKRWQDQCQAIGEDMSDLDQNVFDEIQKNKWTPADLQTEMESVDARIGMTAGGGNQNTLREFEARAKKIDDRKAKLEQYEEKLRELFSQIEELQGRWEPELDQLVGQISEAFAENFSRIQCAGEVAVYKDDDFEQWAIQIKVKFRYDHFLVPLDGIRKAND